MYNKTKNKEAETATSRYLRGDRKKRQHLTLSYPDSYQPEHEVGFPLRPSSLTSEERLEYFQKLAPLVCISFVTNRCAILVPLAVRHTYLRHLFDYTVIVDFLFCP